MHKKPLRRWPRQLQHLAQTTARQRILYGALAGLLVAFWPTAMQAPTRALLGWCVGAFTYLALAWWLAHSFDAGRTRARAQVQDPSNAVIFLLMLLAVLLSVGAIAMVLQQAQSLAAGARLAHIALALLALAASWFTIHMVFAFHYAHRYYQAALQPEAGGPGLEFPGSAAPDYFDFLYYAYGVGMTSQVSDVQATSRAMRRLTLVHSVLSFGFNMALLALGINVVAGAM